MITSQQLKKIAPSATQKNIDIYAPLLNEAFEKYQINTVERIACFLSQVLHESGSFRYVKELATGDAYEGRKDLGNVNPGDGVKFKGRGLIQVTGRINYGLCSKFIFNDERLVTNPEILETPKYALDSACWYWTKRKLNDYADKDSSWRKDWKGSQWDKVAYISILVNGGLNGLNERISFYQRAKEELTKGII